VVAAVACAFSAKSGHPFPKILNLSDELTGGVFGILKAKIIHILTNTLTNKQKYSYLFISKITKRKS
jgi:hypothetical protein